VHDVGDFEASFVPSLGDFDRLDARFKLAPEVWEQLPQYADWGFAVFKLKQKERGFWGRLFKRPARKQTVHPMAFEFPRRDPRSLFFPTVHVHDGEVHEKAHFDHTLYCQPGELIASTFDWEESDGNLGKRVDPDRAAGLVDPDAPCFRTSLVGSLDNRDQELVPPAIDDAARLLRRGRCFELRLGTKSCYPDPRQYPQPSEAWRDNASKHLDALGEKLERQIADVLEARRDELGLADYDDAFRLFGSSQGRIFPPYAPGERHEPADPDESILVELEVSDERVEPQKVRIAFAAPPDPARVAAVQSALDEALAQVRLPG
jgi:hypothetical protein